MIKHTPKAFPSKPNSYSSGMDLRDYFASKALQGLLFHESGERGYSTLDQIAERSYQIADAMMEARKK